MTQEIKEFLEKEGYTQLREIEGRGICGLYRFIYTVGLVYGIDEYGYSGRYCYERAMDALVALAIWDGISDPDDAYWIKHKGGVGEYSNIKNIDNGIKQATGQGHTNSSNGLREYDG